MDLIFWYQLATNDSRDWIHRTAGGFRRFRSNSGFRECGMFHKQASQRELAIL